MKASELIALIEQLSVNLEEDTILVERDKLDIEIVGVYRDQFGAICILIAEEE